MPKIESALKMLNCAVSENRGLEKLMEEKVKKKEILVNVLFANFVKFLKGSSASFHVTVKICIFF